MIDNPEPDKIMAEKEQINLQRNFEDLCKSHAIEIAKHYKVLRGLHDDFAEWYHDYMSQNTHLFEHDCVDLDDAYIKDWWESEGECFDDYDSPYDMIDPTPSGDSPYSDAEYIITAEERDRNSLDSKRESHGHRYYSTNW